jgi:TonB family protein
MNALTLPPHGSNAGPIRDLVMHARANLTRGLLLSALAHIAILATIILLQHREPALRLVEGTVSLIPNPPVVTPPHERPRGEIPNAPQSEGIWDPKPEVPKDLPQGLLDMPPVDVPRGGVGPGSVREGVELPAMVEQADPAEDVFVYFDQEPVPIRHPDPEYPAWARENGISGTVLLHVLVGLDGRVRRVNVIRGVRGLSEAAQEALHRWTFRPAMANGRPVKVWVEIPVQFRLGG